MTVRPFSLWTDSAMVADSKEAIKLEVLRIRVHHSQTHHIIWSTQISDWGFSTPASYLGCPHSNLALKPVILAEAFLDVSWGIPISFGILHYISPRQISSTSRVE